MDYRKSLIRGHCQTVARIVHGSSAPTSRQPGRNPVRVPPGVKTRAGPIPSGDAENRDEHRDRVHLPPDTSERGRTGGKRGRDSSDAFALLRKGIPVQGRVRYRLEESLGAGAFGAVWRASCGERDSGDQDPLPASVAIKFFRAPESAVQEAQIKRELSALLFVAGAQCAAGLRLAGNRPTVLLRHGLLCPGQCGQRVRGGGQAR